MPIRAKSTACNVSSGERMYVLSSFLQDSLSTRFAHNELDVAKHDSVSAAHNTPVLHYAIQRFRLAPMAEITIHEHGLFRIYSYFWHCNVLRFESVHFMLLFTVLIVVYFVHVVKHESAMNWARLGVKSGNPVQVIDLSMRNEHGRGLNSLCMTFG